MNRIDIVFLKNWPGNEWIYVHSTNGQENLNQKHNEILPHSFSDGCYKRLKR